MSRVAKMPIMVKSGVSINVDGGILSVKGAKGHVTCKLDKGVKVEVEGNVLRVVPANDSSEASMQAGTARSIINSLVHGVTNGFEKRLILFGVGYRAQAQGKVLNLTLGYSHPITYKAPDTITIETPSQTEIVIKGANKQEVGQVAAEIRAFRAPDSYKGKGVRYSTERIVLKETKKK